MDKEYNDSTMFLGECNKMLKKLMATALTAILLVFVLAGIAATAEEAANPIPQLNVNLNSDGTTSITFNVTVTDGDAASLIDYYSQTLTKDGYTVEASEDGASMLVKKTFPAEEGYVVDFTLYGIGKISFVEFKDFFTTKYGIRSTVFNAENQPAGETYLKLQIDSPTRASFSNATNIGSNGKSNMWDIVSGSKNEIYMTFKTYNAIPLISTLFAIAVLLVLLYAAYTSRRKKQNNSSDEAPVIIDSFDEFQADEEDSEELENPIEEMDFDEVEPNEDEPRELEEDEETEPEKDSE